MNKKPELNRDTAELADIASRFISARREARPLADYPGTIPADLATAYRIQDLAIHDWRSPVAGWKVGRIPVSIEDQFGIDRLAGPIFEEMIRNGADSEQPEMPVYAGGFAAVEAEYVAVIARDAPSDKLSWSIDEAWDIMADLRIGLEIASSPLATINELGPPVVVSDFGNNAGLIVGPTIKDWRTRPLDTMRCDTFVDGQLVGSGGAYTLTGGFVRSVQFLLELGARRGFPLRKGALIATGQTSGIHDVLPGQNVRLDFGDDGSLSCSIGTMPG